MHCAQARNLVALLIGNDLEDNDRPEVERHLSQCKSCQDYHESLNASHQQLQSIAPEDSGIHSVNLWADLEPAVRLANSGRSSKRFNGWIAGLAIAATVMAMFAISGDFGPVRYNDQNSGFMPPSSVNWEAPANPNIEQKQDPTFSLPIKEREAMQEPRLR